MKSIFKGVLYAVIATLGLVLVFALVIKWANLENGIIKPIVQVIKVLCILFGVGIALKNINRAGWLVGAAVGVLYMVFAFLIFSCIDGNWEIGITTLNDLLFAAAAGVVSAFLLRMRSKNIEA
jgi:putative membrane protein (TIGR04086 family)